MKNRFIVLEGLDGAGKTSIGEYLAKEYGFKSVKTPNATFEQLRSYVDKQDVYTKLMFYYASNFDASQKIEQYMKDSNVICDRYFYSTLVYFAYFSGYTIQETLQLMEGLTGKLLLPDMVVYLTISDDARRKRLKERVIEKSSTDAYFLKNLNKCYVMEKLYLELMEIMSHRVKYVVINTEDTVEASCQKINYEFESVYKPK